MPTTAENTAQTTIPVSGLTCASCVGHVQQALEEQPGVSAANVNLVTREAKVSFDPAGTWSYSTLDDQGSQTTGTMTITGKPGAYTGSVLTAQGQAIPLTNVYTSATGMVVVAPFGDGGTMVIKVTAKADGTVEAGWTPVRNLIAATMTRTR